MYSGTPLAKKLGIKDNCKLLFINAPTNFVETLAPLPDKAIIKQAVKEPLNIIVFFVKTEKELLKRFAALQEALASDGGIWVAWPKKSSGVATDLTFDAAPRVGLAAGLVDNKICAIDEVWSGLRFVWRVKDRPPKSQV